MKKLLLFMMLVMVSFGSIAQEITVKSIKYLEKDLEASRERVLDNNDTPCAYIRILAPRVRGLEFTGIMGQPKYQSGEYGVYVPEGTKRIKFRHDDYQAGTIEFTMPIKKLCVYQVELDVPLIDGSYEDLLSKAKKLYKDYRSHTESEYYYKASVTYDKVLAHDECPPEQRAAIRCERDTMTNIRRFTYWAESGEDKANQAEKALESASGDEYKRLSSQVYKNLSAAYECYRRLAIWHPEVKGFEGKKKEVWERRCKCPDVQETVKETVTVQRQVIAGKAPNSVGKYVYASRFRDTYKKDARQSAKLLGSVAADGSFRYVMPDGYHYLFIEGERQAHYITSDMTTIEIL